MHDIIHVIEKERESKGISVYRLTRDAGISESTYRFYKNGGRPTVELADKLLTALGITYTLGKEK